MLIYVLFLSLSFQGNAAEYLGRDIDGEEFSCTAYSYGTSNFYSVNVIFDDSDATLYFQSGGMVTLSLDSEEIDDPNSISAYDYQHSVFWDLDVDID